MKRINWMSPVIKQWPLFLTWIVLVGWFSLLHHPYPRWFVICLHAYIAASLGFNKWLKVLVYVTAFALYAMEVFLVWGYKLSISPTAISLMAETTPRESYEFLTQILTMSAFWKTLLFGLFMLSLIVCAEKYREKVSNILACIKWIKPVFAAILICGLVCHYVYIELFKCDNLDDVEAWCNNDHYPNDNMTKMVVALFDIHLSNKEMKNQLELLPKTESISPTIQDSVSIVLVIGESYIRQHTPLYGYPLQTTPFMSQEQEAGRLVAFTDAVAPYKFTTEVVRNIISCNSLSDGEKWSQKPPLTAVFRKAGYYVSMYDNQRTYGQTETFAFALDTYLFHPKVIDVCYDEIGNKCYNYDLQLIEDYSKKKRSSTTRELAVFHLMGQHFEANKRYPKEFNYFTADSLNWRKEKWLSHNKRQLIAEYDNATRYNDHVIQRITECYRDKAAILIYVSDHGEEMYDYRDVKGRVGCDDLKQELKYQYAVPMVVWWNEQYANMRPDIVQTLQEVKHRPLIISDIYQLLFHIGGMTNSSYYRSDRDILNNTYKYPVRIVNNKWNYDKIVTAK